MTVDFHAHWVPETLATALRQRPEPPLIKTGNAGPVFEMPVGGLPFDNSYTDLQARLKMMDTQGVATQVLSLPCLFGLDTRPAAEALPLLRLFNDATAEATRQHKGRFAGLASLPWGDVALAAAEYKRARRQGMLGAIVPINYFLSVAGVAALDPFLQTAQAEGGHLFLHPGRRADEAVAEDALGTTRYPDSVMPRRQLEIQHNVAAAMVTLLWGGVADSLRGVSLHVANIGGTLPMVVERMDYTSRLRTHEDMLPSARLRRGGVMVDCASMGPVAITAATRCFGAENILFGSDCPIYRSDWQLAAVRAAEISDSDRRMILTGNSARVLPRWQ